MSERSLPCRNIPVHISHADPSPSVNNCLLAWIYLPVHFTKLASDTDQRETPAVRIRIYGFCWTNECGGGGMCTEEELGWDRILVLYILDEDLGLEQILVPVRGIQGMAPAGEGMS